MQIQLASDLHLEHLARHFPGETLIRPAHQADVLVLAGDVSRAADAISLFGNWPVPVLYVMGNHEAYGGNLQEVQEQLAAAAQGTSVQFLERQTVDFGGVRFLACTLWTDYRLRCNRTQRQLMEHCGLRLNDHRLIRTLKGEHFSPEHALRDHEISRAWLMEELSRPYDGNTVVVTHHAPHPLSVHPRYAGDALNAAFASDLTELLHKADFWLHGHVHDSFDYRIGRCRVVANPRGYAHSLSSAPQASDLVFENSAFNYACVIDTSEGGTSVRAQLARAMAQGRELGMESSEYFLDKCGSEAGDTSAPDEAPAQPK
jgi:predicted phosphodiesterase